MKVPVLFCGFLFGALSAAAQAADTSAASGLRRDTVGIFHQVEADATYPGGFEAWKKFLMRNLDIDAAEKDVRGNKPVTQTVRVRFIVCTDGSLCNVEALGTDVLPSVRREAERMIRKSGKWTPARQDGRNVKAYKTQEITFFLNQ